MNSSSWVRVVGSFVYIEVIGRAILASAITSIEESNARTFVLRIRDEPDFEIKVENGEGKLEELIEAIETARGGVSAAQADVLIERLPKFFEAVNKATAQTGGVAKDFTDPLPFPNKREKKSKSKASTKKETAADTAGAHASA